MIINIVNIFNEPKIIKLIIKLIPDYVNINLIENLNDIKPYSDIDIIIGKLYQYENFIDNYIDRTTLLFDTQDSGIFLSIKALKNPLIKKYYKYSIIKKEYIDNINNLYFLSLKNIEYEKRWGVKKTYSEDDILVIKENYYKFDNLFNFGNIINQEKQKIIIDKIKTFNERKVDISFIGTETLPTHRKLLINKLDELQNKYNINYNLLKKSNDRINFRKYSDIICNSKIVLSPWGNGETCYRDYESFLSQSILIKPDTDFIYIKSDLFIPNKTVFYCKSDWSNLDDVIIESIQKSNIEDRLFVFEKQIEQSSIEYIKNKFLSAL